MKLLNLLSLRTSIKLLTVCTAFLAYSGCSINRANGSNYYLDAENGNNSNNGLSAKTAWKSLDKVNDITLQPGDSLLLRRGSVFEGILEIAGQGQSDKRIVIDSYGTGAKPCIKAPDSSLYAVRIKNSDYVTVQNLEIINTGSQRMGSRTGIKVLCEEYGTSRSITLNALDIHDVNGSLVKREGGGSGILIENRWRETISIFDSLLVENCVIRRCERNAIIFVAPWSRERWHPSINTVVRKNLIEEVPGDGIVPIGCDGALIEYNLMRNCTDLLGPEEAAAGMWPWSCDNTIIQFNEVSDHKAHWDAQGFDSDYNCTNTTIQYNYSHDNDGGFVLICNSGNTKSPRSVGNVGTVVQYNISINDAVRSRKTNRGTYFSPAIHVAGPVKDTRISHNILHADNKPSEVTKRTMVVSDSWDGYADNTDFTENIFFAAEPSEFQFTQSTNDTFLRNYYLGRFKGMPKDEKAQTSSDSYESMLQKNENVYKSLTPLMEKIEIGDGAALLTTVNKKAIEDFFIQLSK